MKRGVIILLLVFRYHNAFTQEQEIKQLLLNVEKLAQFKQMLQDMKKGYAILYKGYTTIRNISEGSFSLHESFLDALLDVSPAVRKYKRVSDIISFQIRIARDHRAALTQFKADDKFTASEIEHMANVYKGLFKRCMRSIDELTMVITAGKLRMSDDERLQAIDRIYYSVIDQYSFLKEFNNTAKILALQRKSWKAEIDLGKKIKGF